MKKILFVFAILLLFVSTSFASNDRDKFLNYIQERSIDFKIQQTKYSKESIGKSETNKENDFKTLYISYIDFYKDIIKYYCGNVGVGFDEEYIKKHKDEYLKYGLDFNIPEGNWDLEEDYIMLINTKGIPESWSEWLMLQEKYITKNRETCMKMRKRGFGCEGGTMTISEREQAIVDLSKIEQKSKAIASIKSQDFDFIPYTSNELAFTYLLGNDLKPIFNQNTKGYIILDKNAKKSFEHFIKKHKDSKYWNLVNEYYKKLKHNNFMYSEDAAVWVVDELNKMN